MLGNNMFVYCLNNPVNRTDVNGAVSLWYYLIIDSDYGFVHRMVQAHIVYTYGSMYGTELSLGGHGRADIVSKDSGAVWEVKHASTQPTLRANIATAQATKYIGGTSGEVTVTTLGAAGAFEGFFYLQCGAYTYEVNYWTPQAGAVLYSVQEVQNYTGEVFAVYVPREERQRSTSGVTSSWFVVGLAFCGGGGYYTKDSFSNCAYLY